MMLRNYEFCFMNFFLKLQLYASPNVSVVCCTNRDSSPRDLYKMTLSVAVHYEDEPRQEKLGKKELSSS